MPEVPKPFADSEDLAGARARWGGFDSVSTFRLSDFGRLGARVPFALALARAALTDRRTFAVTVKAVRRYRALQKPLELFAYLRFLRRLQPARLLEIGTLWGGTFYAHCAVSDPSGRMIAIDSFPRDNRTWMSERFRKLARPGQKVTCVWNDSHLPETVATVAAALNGALLDVLFLDGDHSMEGVQRDYELYSPLVRTRGVIALHDIEAPSSGVSALWQRLRRDHESAEFVDRVHPPHGLGIGVIVKH